MEIDEDDLKKVPKYYNYTILVLEFGYLFEVIFTVEIDGKGDPFGYFF